MREGNSATTDPSHNLHSATDKNNVQIVPGVKYHGIPCRIPVYQLQQPTPTNVIIDVPRLCTCTTIKTLNSIILTD